jgi:hypothetical protein
VSTSKETFARGGTQAALIACAFVLTLLFASAAQADLSFCPTGSDAGQCGRVDNGSFVGGVATDEETGRLYVADPDNHRIDVFEVAGSSVEFKFAFGWKVNKATPEEKLQTCTTATGCQAGSSGSSAGQLTNPRGIAVDNITGSTSRHDIYVTTSDRVQKFAPDGSFISASGWGVETGAEEAQTCTTASGCLKGIEGAGECQLSNGGLSFVDPVAVGPGGNVFLAAASGAEPNFTNRVEKFSPGGGCLGETVLAKGNLVLKALAIDASEDAYVAVDRVSDQLRKYDLATPETKLCSAAAINTNALTINSAGRLFASQRQPKTKGGGDYQVITEYSAACNPLQRFGYGQINSNLKGLAFYPSTAGDLFASEEEGLLRYLNVPSPGPLALNLSATPRTVSAQISAEVNPEGKETKYRIDYVDQHSFETEGGFAGPNTHSTGEVPLGAADFELHSAEVTAGCKPFTQAALNEGKCLKPETAYRYRLVTENADGNTEAEGQLTTGPPVSFVATYATEVGTDTATLGAELTPNGSPASGYFEYVDDATYQADIGSGDGFQHAIKIPDPGAEPPQSPIDFGLGEAALKRSTTPYPLIPGTTYHYRLVVTDPFATLDGPEHTIATFLPDQRSACPANEAFREGPAAYLPDCRAYEMVSPVDKANGDIVNLLQSFTNTPAVLNQAAVSGEKLTYGSYRAFGDAISSPYTTQYIASRNPEVGWQSHAIAPPNEGLIRNGTEFDNEYRVFSPDLCQAWLTPFDEPTLAPGAIPGYFNIYSRTDQLCGGESYEALSTAKAANRDGTTYSLELQGLSADGNVSVFVANDNLKGTTAPKLTLTTSDAQRQLYAKAPGFQPRFVCILPGGKGEPSKESCSAGTGPIGEFNGRLASLTNAISADGKGIFWTNAKTFGKIYLRENPFGTGSECAEASSPCTVEVSKTGEETSGTKESRYWGAADDGSAAVFSTANTGNGVSDLYEFEVGSKTTTLIAHKSLGVLGMSEDASRIYFASSEKLSGEEENSAGDKAVAGKPNLYLYDVREGGRRRFIGTLSSTDLAPGFSVKASTLVAESPLQHNGHVNPDGLHAAFMSSAPLTHYDNTDAKSGVADTEVFLYDAAADGGKGRLVCTSCNPGGGRPLGENVGGEGTNAFWVAARLPAYENSLYAPKVLSPDGTRLYFESIDPLVPRDTNGHFDVYQWEQLGSGGKDGCHEADSTYVPSSGGCVSLISSGQSNRDSEFVDASPSGNDVFINTLSSLLPQDPGLLDIYDARVNGGFAQPTPPPAACEGEACQGPLSALNDPTPASSSFDGAGNVSEAPAAKKNKKTKKKTKHKKHRTAHHKKGKSR